MEAQASFATLLRELLSPVEIEQITQQLNHECRQDSQVLWSGIHRDAAQAWADARNLQTLTTAMGPLMDVQHSSCLKNTKSPGAWSRYIKGASALFAYHIARQSSKVTVLLQPPPEKLNPQGNTNYQLLEEPIVKGAIGGHPVGYIQMVHPTVKGAEDFEYQSWPVDRTEDWTKKFAHLAIARISWRPVGTNPMIRRIIATVTVAQSGISDAEPMACSSFNADPTKSNRVSIIVEQKVIAFNVPQLQDKAQIDKAKGNPVQKVTGAKQVTKKSKDAKAHKKKAEEEKTKRATKLKTQVKEINKKLAEKARKVKAANRKANNEKAEKAAKARQAKAQRKKANKEKAAKEKAAKALKMKAAKDKAAKEKAVKAQKLKAAKERAQKAREEAKAHQKTTGKDEGKKSR